jgi:hypothetical protein
MRHERQPKDQLVLSLEVILGGIGQTGLAATTFFLLQRLSDAKYLDLTTGLWTVGVPGATNVLGEVDAVNLPGLYEFTVPGTALTPADLLLAGAGYRFRVAESSISMAEHGRISVGPVKGGEWDEAESAHHDTAGTMGNTAARILRLRQNNMRFVPTAWDSVTRQPTTGLVLSYDSKADLNADTGPAWALATGRYTVDATFDLNGQLTEYTSVRDA